jgi:hypothetical protein
VIALAFQVVDWSVILDIILGAVVAGLGVTVMFAIAIVGASGLGQARREGRGGSTIFYGAVTALGLTGFFGGAVFAVLIIVDK